MLTLLDLFELAAGGTARRLASMPLSGATMVHDFIATPHYLVVFTPPLRLHLPRMLLGLGTYADNLVWRPAAGTEVLVIPLANPSRPRRFTVEPFYQWHFANAYEHGSDLIVDVVRYADFSTNQWLQELIHGTPSHAANGTFYRTIIDPDTQTCNRGSTHWSPRSPGATGR
jgi:all-trans-8'-apo-beta-carotenal 15,15'-oxygenase